MEDSTKELEWKVLKWIEQFLPSLQIQYDFLEEEVKWLKQIIQNLHFLLHSFVDSFVIIQNFLRFIILKQIVTDEKSTPKIKFPTQFLVQTFNQLKLYEEFFHCSLETFFLKPTVNSSSISQICALVFGIITFK